MNRKQLRQELREAFRPTQIKPCGACQRLQRFKPGGKCLDCQEALDWASKQQKVGENELDLILTAKTIRICQNESCRNHKLKNPLPEGYYRLCPVCHGLKSQQGIFDNDFTLKLPGRAKFE